jgi:hypothetical protein
VRKWREWPGCPPILLADHCGVAGFINFHEQLVEAFALYADMLELGPSIRQAVLDKHDLFNSHGVGKDLRESSGGRGVAGVSKKTYNTELMDDNQNTEAGKQETDGSLGCWAVLEHVICLGVPNVLLKQRTLTAEKSPWNM